MEIWLARISIDIQEKATTRAREAGRARGDLSPGTGEGASARGIRSGDEKGEAAATEDTADGAAIADAHFGVWLRLFRARLHEYVEAGLAPAITGDSDAFLKAPLMFDPGTHWEYGISYDWLGELVEQVSGETLEEYFRRHIFEPLGMTDTFFNVPAEKQARVVALQLRQADGSFVEPPPQPMKPLRFFSGGGGLYSTAGDYLKFERMVLNGGMFGGKRILRAETVAEMSHNQIGEMKLAELRSTIPQLIKNPVRLPGSPDKFGWGFGINSRAVEGGRAAGSLAWDGIFNTFFWIDVSGKTCGVVLMQTLPFSDDGALAAEEEFERALYASAAR